MKQICKSSYLLNLTSSLVITLLAFPAYALGPAKAPSVGTAGAPQMVIKLDLPGDFRNVGILREKSAGDRAIMVSGKEYFYGVNTKVYSEQSKFSSIQSITSGTPIGFNFTVGPQGQRFIYEVWVLAKDSKLPIISEVLN